MNYFKKILKREMDLRNEDYYKNLINCHLSHQISEKNNEELLRWINQSENNKKQFIELSRTFKLTSLATPRGKFNKAKYVEWNKLSDKLSSDDKKNPVIITPLQKVIRIAAVFFLLVALGTTFAWIITSNKLQNLISQETVHQIYVPLGGRSEVILPDGSKVRLNAGSNLSYSANFGYDNRNVLLEGEGHFEVETNPQIPFVVEASGLKIKAYGTIFNIKAYPEEEEITTTLVEGIVKIEGENIDLTMSPFQKVTYTKHKQVLPDQEGQIKDEEEPIIAEKVKKGKVVRAPVTLANNVDIREITSWKDGVFIFNSEKLSNLSVILARKYDVSIKIESEELNNHKFTGTFHQETLEQILGIINMSAPINYKIEKGVVSIRLDKERSVIFKELSPD